MFKEWNAIREWVLIKLDLPGSDEKVLVRDVHRKKTIALRTRDFDGARTRWLLNVIRPIRPKA